MTDLLTPESKGLQQSLRQMCCSVTANQYGVAFIKQHRLCDAEEEGGSGRAAGTGAAA